MTAGVLVVENGSRRGERIEIDPPTVRIGRAEDNDVVLEDDAITAQHARIDIRRGRFRIQDLGSLNGTFVNDRRVQMQELYDGDRVRIGRVRLRLLAGANASRVITQPGVSSYDSEEIIQQTRSTAPIPRDASSLAAAHGRLRVVLELSERISNVYEVDAALSAGIEVLIGQIAADRVAILLKDPVTDELTPYVTHPNGPPPEISKAILCDVMDLGKAVLLDDAQADERFAERESIIAGAVTSVLCVPLRTEKGILGVCYMDHQGLRDAFQPEQLQLATLIANVLAQRLEHIHLYEETLRVETLKILNTEMAETNARLVELEAFKNDMINMIVHDMKGPLATAMMSLDVMLAEIGEQLPADGTNYVGIVKRNLRKLNEMIMNLLELAKLEEGKLEPELTQVALKPFIENFVESMRPYADGTDVELQTEVRGDITLWTDQALLERMLLNLAMNAINHSFEGTVVRVRVAEPKPGMVAIAVEDEGEGIPPEIQDRIFEKFVQADARALGIKTDVGLGLAFCKMACESLGGRISVKSEPGFGSRFTLALPNTPPT